MEEDNLDKPEKFSYSNFNDFLEAIDKEKEGIFAHVFPNNSHAVELYLDNIYANISVENIWKMLRNSRGWRVGLVSLRIMKINIFCDIA